MPDSPPASSPPTRCQPAATTSYVPAHQLWQDQGGHRAAEPHRDPDQLLRGVPPEGRRRLASARTPACRPSSRRSSRSRATTRRSTLDFAQLRDRRAEADRARGACARARPSAPRSTSPSTLEEEAGTKEERVYMGELPADDRPRHVRHQRRRARRRQPAAPLARHLLRGQPCTSTASCSTASASSPTAAPGCEVQFDTNDLLYVYLDRRSRRRKFLATTLPPRDRLRRPTRTSSSCSTTSRSSSSRRTSTKRSSPPRCSSATSSTAKSSSRAPSSRSPTGIVRQLIELGDKTVQVVDTRLRTTLLIKSLKKDPAHDEEEALKDIYRRLRPGDPPTVAERPRPAQAPLLRSEALRPRPRRPLQDQPEARPQGRRTTSAS